MNTKPNFQVAPPPPPYVSGLVFTLNLSTTKSCTFKLLKIYSSALLEKYHIWRDSCAFAFIIFGTATFTEMKLLTLVYPLQSKG
jgi:hypothetical protein